jgi:hypothetical protein
LWRRPLAGDFAVSKPPPGRRRHEEYPVSIRHVTAAQELLLRRGAYPLNHLNRVAVANSPGLHYAAENAAPSAKRFLESLPNRIHLMARLAFLGDFQQRFAYAHPLAHGQAFKYDPASRDVLLGASWGDAECFQRLQVHQEHLPPAAAPSVDAVLESFVFDGEHIVEFADRLAVRQRLKQMQNFSHGVRLQRRTIW